MERTRRHGLVPSHSRSDVTYLVCNAAKVHNPEVKTGGWSCGDEGGLNRRITSSVRLTSLPVSSAETLIHLTPRVSVCPENKLLLVCCGLEIPAKGAFQSEERIFFPEQTQEQYCHFFPLDDFSAEYIHKQLLATENPPHFLTCYVWRNFRPTEFIQMFFNCFRSWNTSDPYPPSPAAQSNIYLTPK